MALSASLTPSGNFNLSNWKLTLPVDANGTITGTAVEVTNLINYWRSPYFYTGSDGAMVFQAAVDGATTSGSSFARSELREMNGTSRAAWNLTTGGVMAATLEVDAAPTRFDGTMGKMVVGQIHGQSDELVRLYWDNSKLYFANDHAGADNTAQKFYFTNAAGLQPNVSLNEKFGYVIDAKGSSLEVTIYADGDVYRSVTQINSVWQSDTFYFKAGTYLGVNETQATGFGQTSFYDLRFNHTDTTLTPIVPSVEYVLPITTTTITGNSSNNVLNGNSGNDLIKGLGGNDILRGRAGSDVLWGGDGADVFVFNTAIGRDIDVIMDFAPGQDLIHLENAIMRNLSGAGNLQAGNFALDYAKDTNDYIVYNQTTGNLAYDADGSGSGQAVVFAHIHNHAALSAANFMVI